MSNGEGVPQEPSPGRQRPAHEDVVGITRDLLPIEVLEAQRAGGAVFGKYVLLEELGRGGTGYVRKAWDTMLAHFVALKFIHFDPPTGIASEQVRLGEEERIRNLILEARAAARFRHPHIVPVHDVGRIGEQYYISMQYIEGTSLHAQLNASRSRGWISSLYERPAPTLALLRDVASAVDYAHTFQPSVIHCDLKPSNILIDLKDVCFVVDFGLARVVEAGREENIGIQGTPAYMAPEQLRGKASEIGVFTDVYGFGAVLYVMLAGAPVFGGTSMEIIDAVDKKTPVRPSLMVRTQKKSSERMWDSPILPYLYHLEEICLRCLAKRPEDRYRSAAAVAQELQGVLDLVEGGTSRKASSASPAKAAAAPWEPPGQDTALADGAVASFRARLAARMNSQRPVVPDFMPDVAPGGTLQILKATSARIYALRRGVVSTLEWSQIASPQAVSLAATAGMAAPEDRLALGILSMQDGQAQESTRFFESLKGTPLEESSRRLMGRAGGGGGGGDSGPIDIDFA